MERGFLLDVVICEGAAIFELLAREDEALLVRGDTLLVLDFRLHVVDGVRRLHLQGDGLTRDCEVRKGEGEEGEGRGQRATSMSENKAMKVSLRRGRGAPRGCYPGPRDATSDDADELTMHVR